MPFQTYCAPCGPYIFQHEDLHGWPPALAWPALWTSVPCFSSLWLRPLPTSSFLRLPSSFLCLPQSFHSHHYTTGFEVFLCVGFLVMVIILPINCVGDEVDNLIATVSKARVAGMGWQANTGCCTSWVCGGVEGVRSLSRLVAVFHIA